MPVKTAAQIACSMIGLVALILLTARESLIGCALSIAGGLLVADMYWNRISIFGGSLRTIGRKRTSLVALTFDDGPSEWTPMILDVLDKWNVKATFFLIGAHVRRHPEIARRIATSGHSVGVHTMTHRKLHFCGPGTIRRELDLCLRAFAQARLPLPRLVRFPHGRKNLFAMREARRRGLTVCCWSLGVWDSVQCGRDMVVRRAERIEDGGILLLHDGDGAGHCASRLQTVEATDDIIRKLLERGLRIVPLDAVVSAPGSRS